MRKPKRPSVNGSHREQQAGAGERRTARIDDSIMYGRWLEGLAELGAAMRKPKRPSVNGSQQEQ